MSKDWLDDWAQEQEDMKSYLDNPNFKPWLLSLAGTNRITGPWGFTPIVDLADDCKGDTGLPRSAAPCRADYDRWVTFLESRRACEGALKALRTAYRTYTMLKGMDVIPSTNEGYTDEYWGTGITCDYDEQEYWRALTQRECTNGQ